MVIKMLVKQLQKKDNWIYIIIALLCTVLFFYSFWNADEIWNYNFAKAVVEGLLPYKDINMVSTPLSIYISALFLKLFGEGLLAYRVAGYALMVLCFSLLYNINKRISGNTLFSFMGMLMMYALNYAIYIYNYNNVILCIILIILLFELKSETYKDSFWKNVCIGMLVGFLPLIKQSIGVVMLVAHAIVCGLYILYEKRKRYIYLFRIVFSSLPCLGYLAYLVCSDTFREFIKYAILGIQSFTYRISFVDYMFLSPLNFMIALFPIMVSVYAVYDLVIKKNGNIKKYVFSIYVIAWLCIVSYPMFDEQHFFCGANSSGSITVFIYGK